MNIFIKFLGITFTVDENLTWNEHTKWAKGELSPSLYNLNTMKHTANSCTLRTLYNSLLYPYLNYGILLWKNACKSYQKQAVLLHNKAL